jgi:hypothetical protein
MNDTVAMTELPSVSREQVERQVRALMLVCDPEEAPGGEPSAPARRGRGRPCQVAAEHLWLGLLWAVLAGLTG